MVLHVLLQEVRSETCKWKGKNKSRIEKRRRQENECVGKKRSQRSHKLMQLLDLKENDVWSMKEKKQYIKRN